jgi:hypothetical protein
MEWWEVALLVGPATITSVAALISAANTRRALSLQERRDADRLLNEKIEAGVLAAFSKLPRGV